MMADFVGASNKIVAVLKMLSKDLDEDERVRYVYNDAIDDAVNFVRSLGESNPDIRLASIRLAREMREYLPLRSEAK